MFRALLPNTINDEELNVLFRIYDQNGDGKISFKEYVNYVSVISGNDKR